MKQSCRDNNVQVSLPHVLLALYFISDCLSNIYNSSLSAKYFGTENRPLKLSPLTLLGNSSSRTDFVSAIDLKLEHCQCHIANTYHDHFGNATSLWGLQVCSWQSTWGQISREREREEMGRWSNIRLIADPAVANDDITIMPLSLLWGKFEQKTLLKRKFRNVSRPSCYWQGQGWKFFLWKQKDTILTMFLLSGRAEARTDRKREFRNLKRKRSKLIKHRKNCECCPVSLLIVR